MCSTLLIIHSWVRWLALVAGVAATIAVYRGTDAGPAARSRSSGDAWGQLLMMALDIQLLVGLLLYLVVSPNMAEIRAHFPEAMKDPALRFWAVEHISMMFVAVILTHVGRVLARKAATPEKKRRALLVCFGIATLAMIAGTPWPGTRGGRPLFRF
jgi:hypothetical protein